MPAAVVRLTERNLESTSSRTPYLLVRVGLGIPAFHRGLAEYFDSRFRGAFTFGVMSRADWSVPRLTELFHSAVGRLRGGVGDGYYLFEAGLVVGHHVGATRPPTVSYGADAEGEAVKQRILSTPLGSDRLSSPDLEALRQLVAYFEPIVERKQRASGFGSEWVTDGHEPPPPPPPPPRQPKETTGPDPSDPYVILGITAAATDDEVKTAYRTQMKLNHPDKVAHLSPALQAFAQQQTLVVKGAYDAILARRRGG
ncbi:MAG: DnaJ domain-containing protein [Myxococcota bacterium]